LNAIYYKWRGVNFPPGRIEFLQRNGPKQSKICTLGAAKYFPCFEKEKRFLEIKKEHSTK
jgi:hypothetical protein